MTEVEVADQAWSAALPAAAELADQAALATLARVNPAKAGEIAILLTDDAALRNLNSRFLGKDKPTNVLSFPAGDGMAGHLGDIALAFGVCAAEAAEQGKPLAHHLQHLVAHGVLHLIGYDHISDADAEVMEDLERRVLAGLGIPDPYSTDDAPR
ncbi:MAG: rRNA maturation RNase YbeY [Alphaproteobacteria bacterium]